MVNAGAAFFLACSMAAQSGSPDYLLQSQDQKIINEHLNNFYKTNSDIVNRTADDFSLIKTSILSDQYILMLDVNEDGVLNSADLMSAVNNYYDSQKKVMPVETAPPVTEKPAEEKVTEPPAPVTEAPAVTEAEKPAVTEAPVEFAETPEAVNSADNSIDDSDITTYGIDVSAYQGRIDWQRIKNAGISFAMIKAGESFYVAERFEENIKNAHAAGINVGVYWFSHAQSVQEAKNEADFCLKTISGYKLEFPVVCDYEYSALRNGTSPLANDRKAMTDTVMAFMQRTQDNGYYSMLYTNTDFSKRFLDMDRITADFDIWFAGYSVSSPTMKCGIWQYSEKGVVDGIDADNPYSGQKVDLDIAYKNYPAKMKKFHVNGY